MDLLAGYESSSSASSQLLSVGAAPPHRLGAGTDGGNDSVRTCGPENPFPENAPGDLAGTGGSGHGPPGATLDIGGIGTAGGRDDGFRQRGDGAAVKRPIAKSLDSGYGMSDGAFRAEKKRKHQLAGEDGKEEIKQRVTISGYDDRRQGGNGINFRAPSHQFERCQPHWEGRWVGHLYFPLPPIDSLDTLEGEDTNGLFDIDINHTRASDGQHAKNDIKAAESCEDSMTGESSSDDGEEDHMAMSRMFLPTARKLIRHWAKILEGEGTFGSDGCYDKKCGTPGGTDTAPVIVPHIPMHPAPRTASQTRALARSEGPAPDEKPLHISLARPIYLPAPSVDPFLADVGRSIKVVLSFAKGRNGAGGPSGRTVQLRPRDAKILVNDSRTRSFLAMPVSEESSRWAKRILLPPIDASMSRFGLETYYSDGGGGCILHVSIASVQGNAVPRMLRRRGVRGGSEERAAFAPFFRIDGAQNDRRCGERESESSLFESLPKSIPVEINQILCEFGKEKQLMIPI